MYLRHAIILAVVAMLCTACGGGGSDSSDDSTTTTPPPVTQADLGTRLVPGFAVQVERLADAPAGMMTVRAVITPDAGMSAPATVEAAIATQLPVSADWVAGAADPALANAWTWTTSATIPADLHVWVRVTDVDGNTASSGAQDFALGQ